MRALHLVCEIVARLVRATWRVLGRAWKCRHPSPDPLQWTFVLRDVIGVVVIVVVTRVWRMKHFDATVELGSAVTNRFTAALVLVVVVPGAALVFALIARRGLRLRAWSLSAIPVFAVLSTVAVAVGPSLFARTAAGQTVAYWISMGVNALMTRSGPFALVIALVLGALTAFVGLVMVTGWSRASSCLSALRFGPAMHTRSWPRWSPSVWRSARCLSVSGSDFPALTPRCRCGSPGPSPSAGRSWSLPCRSGRSCGCEHLAFGFANLIGEWLATPSQGASTEPSAVPQH